MAGRGQKTLCHCDRLKTTTLSRHWNRHEVNGRFQGPTAIREFAVAGTLSANADIEADRVLRQQCGGLLTVAASSSGRQLPASANSHFPTLCSPSTWSARSGSSQDTTAVRTVTSEGDPQK